MNEKLQGRVIITTRVLWAGVGLLTWGRREEVSARLGGTETAGVNPVQPA